MLYPLTFHPIFKERIWGGRNLERLFQKHLPSNGRIGESWEVSDRPGDESVISNGSHAGKSLRWLMENYHRELLGHAAPAENGRFPLLIKILDAQEKLSLQVHPPASKAVALGGEPKTEMWYIADAAPEADLFVGLKKGTTRSEFEEKIQDGSVTECFQRIHVKRGDAMFLPSGRVHAIGAGNVIFEIQQNSDTTYRVFDWNRVDANGKPRDLHIKESLESINFHDIEPSPIQSDVRQINGGLLRPLVRDPLFDVDFCQLDSRGIFSTEDRKLQVIGVLSGALALDYPDTTLSLGPGQFVLFPAELNQIPVKTSVPTEFLHVKAG